MFYIEAEELVQISQLVCVIMCQVLKFVHSSVLLVTRGSHEGHKIQLLTA